MPKKTNKANIGLIIILIIIVLLLIIYLFVPFLNNSILKRIFTPFCGIKSLYQGEEYLPAWCLEGMSIEQEDEDLDTNDNINTNINTNTNKPVGLANPAAVKCEDDGGMLEDYLTEEGVDALCVFSDQSICNEWDYFRGDCQPGECFKECRAIGTKNEGWYNSCTGQKIKLEVCQQETTNEEEEVEGDVEDENNVEEKSIKIISPINNEQLSSPFKVEGQAIVKDNLVYIRVKNSAGTVLIEESATAVNKPGSEWADFDIEISYEFETTKEGFVEIYSLDQDDNEINIITIPVKF